MLRKNLARLIVLGFVAASGTAGAQWDPESGDTGQWQPPPEEQPQQQQQPAQQQPPAQQQQQQETPWGGPPPAEPEPEPNPAWGQQPPEETEVPEEPTTNGDTDHSKVSFGLSFFGFERFQVDPGSLGVIDADFAGGAFSLGITTVGVRYWVADTIGLDIGLGLGMSFADNTNDDPGAPATIIGQDDSFGLRVHFGLPVALKTFQHFNILLIPELDFTYASTTYFKSPTDPAQDIDVSAIAFDLGLKVGGELQFGFWGVPNLSLQATIGLGFRYASRSAENSLVFGAGGVGVSDSSVTLATLANQLGSAIRINYYF